MSTRPLHELLAWNVRRLAHAKGISLPAIADAIGIQHAQLLAIFSGEFDPDLDLLNAIANALGVGLSDLVSDTELN